MNEKPETSEGVDPSGMPEAVDDLRAARELRGLSLRDVFVATRVSLVNLQAVETGDFDRLPPPVYARNFIRKYAWAVGIDERPLLARYERYLEHHRPPHPEEEVRRPWPENGRRWRFLVLSLTAVILAGVLVYAFFLYDSAPPADIPAPAAPPAEQRVAAPVPVTPEPTEASSTAGSAPAAVEPFPGPAPSAAPPLPPSPTPPSPAPPTATVAASPPPPQPSAAENPSPVTTPAVAAGEAKRSLVVAARELTWIRITPDGGPPYEALLQPGDRIERTAVDHFLLLIGNAGGVHLTFEDRELGIPGKSGQVLQVRLPEKEPEPSRTP